MPTHFRYRLLFVGVNAAADGLGLHAAARDARAMSARFTGWGFADASRHQLLAGADASTAAIAGATRSIVGGSAVDLLLVYWAGAAQGRGRSMRLATADGSIDLERLTSAALLARARHHVLVLDTCGAAPLAPHLRAIERQISPGSCLAIFAGTAPDARAREYHRRGYFTGALLEQLPPLARGVPPRIDLLRALHTAATNFGARHRFQPHVGVAGVPAPLLLNPPETRARAA